MKTYLKVPYEQKDRAKALGARFDVARKSWYCPDGIDLMVFAEWLSADVRKWAKIPKKKKRGRLGGPDKTATELRETSLQHFRSL